MRTSDRRISPTVTPTRLVVGLVLSCLATFHLDARPVKDSKGTDFWLAFLPNAHTQSVGTLIVYVTSETPTTGVIHYVNKRNMNVDVRFTISAANSEYRLSVPYQDLELDSYEYNARTQNDAERAVPYTMHITSAQEVTVYAEAREETSTDAWLVLPTDVLGTDHYVMSYPSNGSYGFIGPFRSGIVEQYPSQFCVIATQNNTRVTITNAVGRSAMGAWTQRTVTLQAGQVYLVQAYLDRSNLNDDLTGSRVTSSKPVAVISGVLRTELPRLDPNLASRDCLIEQMPPVSTWGLSSVVVPPLPARDQFLLNANDGPLYRILAAEAGTVVTINGVVTDTLGQGQFYEGLLSTVKVIAATKPILVASYLRTSRRRGSGGSQPSLSGDPSMFIDPPTEQFLPSYTVINIEPDLNRPYYTQHVLTVILPTADSTSLSIDGSVRTLNSVPIVGTAYSYAHLSVGRGPHTVSCAGPFGIYVYGYGVAESYGYIGGMAFERLRIPHARLVVHDTSGASGDSAALVVTYKGTTDSAAFFALGIRRLTGSLHWNATQFVGTPGQGQHGHDHSALVDRDVAFDTLIAGDTVMRLQGRLVLGNRELDSVLLDNIAWFDAAGDSVDVITDVDQGAITLTKICRDTAARLFDPGASPQPVRIDVVDVVGRLHATFYRSPADVPALDVFLRAQGVPSGAWFIIEHTIPAPRTHRILLNP